MTSEAPKFSDVFGEMTGPGGLTADSVRRVFDAIFAGAWPPASVSAFLIALRLTGSETPAVIAAAAKAMRAAMIPVAHSHAVLLDTCGTGGDGAGTLNLSTAAALIAAAAGVPVAKHGNRAASSRAGSADVLEAMGVALDVAGGRQSEILAEAGKRSQPAVEGARELRAMREEAFQLLQLLRGDGRLQLRETVIAAEHVRQIEGERPFHSVMEPK